MSAGSLSWLALTLQPLGRSRPIGTSMSGTSQRLLVKRATGYRFLHEPIFPYGSGRELLPKTFYLCRPKSSSWTVVVEYQSACWGWLQRKTSPCCTRARAAVLQWSWATPTRPLMLMNGWFGVDGAERRRHLKMANDALFDFGVLLFSLPTVRQSERMVLLRHCWPNSGRVRMDHRPKPEYGIRSSSLCRFRVRFYRLLGGGVKISEYACSSTSTDRRGRYCRGSCSKRNSGKNPGCHFHVRVPCSVKQSARTGCPAPKGRSCPLHRGRDGHVVVHFLLNFETCLVLFPEKDTSHAVLIRSAAQHVCLASGEGSYRSTNARLRGRNMETGRSVPSRPRAKRAATVPVALSRLSRVGRASPLAWSVHIAMPNGSLWSPLITSPCSSIANITSPSPGAMFMPNQVGATITSYATRALPARGITTCSSTRMVPTSLSLVGYVESQHPQPHGYRHERRCF